LSEIDPDGLEVLTLAEVSQRRRPRIEDVMCGNIIANRCKKSKTLCCCDHILTGTKENGSYLSRVMARVRGRTSLRAAPVGSLVSMSAEKRSVRRY
jgi:hypothetical protein